LASCASGPGGSRSAPHPADHFVGTTIEGVALLSWANTNGRLAVVIDMTRTDPARPSGVVEDRRSLVGRLDRGRVALQSPTGPPWSGSFEGSNLVLVWAPVADRFETTTFSPGDAARYRAAAVDFRHQAAQIQDAASRRSQAIADAQALKDQQQQAAAIVRAQSNAATHQAQVAASRQAHNDRVAAMRAAHAAAVAAMEQRNATARARAVAHRH
jgi:hypothetical protein